MEKPYESPQLERRSLLDCFGGAERALLKEVQTVLAGLSPRSRLEVESTIEQAARILPPLAEALAASPITVGHEQLGGRERSTESLIESLCAKEWLPSNYALPTGAVLGRSLVLARINFLKALRYSLEACRNQETIGVLDSLQDAIDEAIFSQLAEELLTAAVSNSKNDYELRRAAALKLFNLWSDRLQQQVGDFPTVLLSAWRARCKVRTVYGTLFGSEEVLSLLRGACEERFVNYFTRDQVTRDQTEAFREFLFGLPFEELQRVRLYMKEKELPVISPDEVQQLLGGVGEFRRPHFRPPSAEEMVASYWRRRVRAEYRALSSSPGPHKTAEGYIMETVLREEIGTMRRAAQG